MARVRVYARKCLETDDERINAVRMTFSRCHKKFRETPVFKDACESFCNDMRSVLRVNEVLGFHYDEEKEMTDIFIYPVKALNHRFYPQKLNEQGKPYIEAGPFDEIIQQ